MTKISADRQLPMKLSEAAIRKAGRADKAQKLADGGGLFLVVNPSGARWWLFRYRVDGKEKILSLGTYPQTSLSVARIKRNAARRVVHEGIDPGAQRKTGKESITRINMQTKRKMQSTRQTI